MGALQEVLDLSIVFTKPPLNSSPEVLAGVALRCEALNLEHTGDLFTDPLTQDERDDLFWYLEEYWKWPYMEFAERGKRVEALLSEVGRRLYQALFQGREAQNIFQAWQQQGNVRHQISIVSEIARILRLPWELLSDPQGLLVLHASHAISIVRRLPKDDQTTLITPIQLPLRVLLVTARPEDAGFVDPRSVSRELVDELQRQSEAETIELEFLRPPTFAALRIRLKNTDRPIHVLHFDGHGGLDDEAKQGMLLFESKAGKASPVIASHLAQLLSTSGVQLAVLTACQSAINTEDDAFSSVSTQLISNGVGAVIAMSSSILVTSAALYVEAFYHALAGGLPVSIAQEQARQALQRDPHRHLFSHRQDKEAAPVKLSDWWVPHFYQQTPLLLQPIGTRNKEIHQETKPALSVKMPKAPRYGFSGRSHEMLRLERWLGQNKLVVIHGFGGIGKTALAREAADWFTQTGMYQGACFVSFEGGRGNANGLLSQLGFFLGIYDETYIPDDPKEALQHLQAILKERRTLVIADNLESILPGGEAPFDALERAQLWNVLLDLQGLGAGVLLTSRTTTFGDGRLTEGARVVYLQLGELGREDAYQLASNLLTNLRIDRRRAPYHLLRVLLQQLGYHPLSLQLVLPALRAHELWQILQNFVALLPRFTDDAETGRNRSLLASLEYSLHRLSEQHRVLLLRLEVFEGGAIEEDLLTITEIAQADWAELRNALEQAALLTVELLEGVESPFLHFHPVLIPFLRGQPGSQREVLKSRYAQRYAQASAYYYEEDKRHPMLVRAVVQRELPNLRRAFGWMLEGGDLEQAVEMAANIDRFLDIFGLHREQQQMHQRVAEAFATHKQSFAGTLTQAEYLHEWNLGNEELRKGYQKFAHARYQRLLARVESQPKGNPFGPGSFQHASVLTRLGRCLLAEGDFSEAEALYRRAIALNEVLIQHDPEDQTLLNQQANLLADLGDALLQQERYAQAKQTHEQALQIKERLGDLRGQAISRLQLGTIAFEQGEHSEARRRYQQVIEVFRNLGETASEAIVWHQLGTMAQREKNWPEAERCYRESLLLKEQLGDRVGTARTCSHLGLVAQYTKHFEEAKSWFRRAIVLGQQANPTSGAYASYLYNLANCLIQEAQAETVQEVSLQLEEARRYAEQSLAIAQMLRSPELWMTFYLLATIAEMQGRHEAAPAYRHQERNAFANFAGHRDQIDQQFGQLFPALVTALDDLDVRVKMEELLSQAEANGWHISEALHRIWTGERDWQSLAENLDSKDALFVLRVLETLAGGTDSTTHTRSPEQILSTLPPAIREALAKEDPQAFQQAFEALSVQEQQTVMGLIQVLQIQQGDEQEEPS